MEIIERLESGQLVLEPRTRNQKVARSNPGRSRERIFFSKVDFLYRLLFGVRSSPVLPQWHVEDPSHSAKSVGGGYT